MCSHVASGSWVLAKHSDWNKQVHDFEISTLEAPSRIISDGDPECLVPSTRTPYAHSATGSWVLAKHNDWNKTFNDFEISRLKAPSRIISDQDLLSLPPSAFCMISDVFHCFSLLFNRFLFFMLIPARCLRGARGRKGWPLVPLTSNGFNRFCVSFKGFQHQQQQQLYLRLFVFIYVRGARGRKGWPLVPLTSSGVNICLCVFQGISSTTTALFTFICVHLRPRSAV